MIRRALLPLFVALAAGCTVGPDYVRPDIDTPEHWRVPVTEAETIADTAWWRAFGDPVLDALIDEALRNNRDLRIAAARVDEYAAYLGITRSEFFPQVGYGAGASRREAGADVPGGASGDLFEATLNLGWEIDLWGRIRRASEAARADLLAAEASRHAVILSLAAAVATGYVQLRNLDRQLEIARETVKSRAQSVRLFELKFRGGVISELELAQVRSEYEQAAVRVPALERQIALQENALSVLLGRNPGPIERGKPADGLHLPPVPAGLPADLLTRRPDVQAAEQVLISANARIGVARARYLPTISLTGVFGQASDELGALFDSGANHWTIGAGILGPLFTGGRVRSEVAASEAIQRQMLERYLAAIQTAFREVDDALVSVARRRDELAARGRQVAALRMYAKKARARYNEGYVSYIEVLDAERRLFDTELLEEQARADLYAALVSLYKAMGGGWSATPPAPPNPPGETEPAAAAPVTPKDDPTGT